ncbi:MAG: hypothetical protein R3325_06735 [Thermoanaerobaculia bacterium]|nr:hypothetical protein [Thermoanaerobaculia bacterium]
MTRGWIRDWRGNENVYWEAFDESRSGGGDSAASKTAGRRAMRDFRAALEVEVRQTESGSSVIGTLPWGTPVELPGFDFFAGQGTRVVASVGGSQIDGWVPHSAVAAHAFVAPDVGQGDGVLTRFPDGRHMLIDGGLPRSHQQSGKNAADLVDWKFFVDYGELDVRLDAIVASHCGKDHYGGLDDLVSRSAGVRAELGRGSSSGATTWEPARSAGWGCRSGPSTARSTCRGGRTAPPASVCSRR